MNNNQLEAIKYILDKIGNGINYAEAMNLIHEVLDHKPKPKYQGGEDAR